MTHRTCLLFVISLEVPLLLPLLSTLPTRICKLPSHHTLRQQVGLLGLHNHCYMMLLHNWASQMVLLAQVSPVQQGAERAV